MSGFSLVTIPTSPQIRQWFGTSGADEGLNFDFTNLSLGSQDIAFGYQGNDTIDVGLSPSAVVFGGQGDDSIVGSPLFLSISVLSGDLGADTIVSQGGSVSLLFGGQGGDSLVGSGANIVETIWGGQGADTVKGGDGSDFLSGDIGTDLIWGDDGAGGAGPSNDTILGGADSDTVVGGGFNDSIRGGQANDYLEVDAALVGSVVPSSDDVVRGSDTVFGDAGDDTIGRLGATVGVTGTDWYSGGDGADSIQGGNNGDNIGDTLLGGAGNDTIRGGTAMSGADSIVGGAGNDSIAGGGETATADNTFAQGITVPQLGDTILGGAGDDNIQGEAGHDSIDGGIGNDFIDGGNDGDILVGGDQNDTLLGQNGADSLVGGNDADTLEGGAGSDTLTGFDGTGTGDGTDLFLYNLTPILGAGNTTVGTVQNVPAAITEAAADYIEAFDVNQDQIQIGTLNFTNVSLDGGTTFQTVTFGDRPVNVAVNGVAQATTATVGSTNITTSPTNGANALIYVERDGVAGFIDGTDIALVTLIGVAPANLSATNFV